MKIELLKIEKKGLVIDKQEWYINETNFTNDLLAGYILRINEVEYKINENGSLEPIKDKKFKEIFNQ